jgi:hypothetical protein
LLKIWSAKCGSVAVSGGGSWLTSRTAGLDAEPSRFTGPLLIGLLAIMALAGCASRPINEPITQFDPKSGYRPYLLIPKRQNNDPSTLFVLSFSGGGTRAAAFSERPPAELARGRDPGLPRGRSQLRQALREQRGVIAHRQQLRPHRHRVAVPVGRRAVTFARARPYPPAS